MDDSGAAEGTPVPVGYTLVKSVGRGCAGRALLCRAADGRDVVVRILDRLDVGEPASVESELRALAAAGDHACSVRTTRVWVDDIVGLCLEQEFCPGGSLAAAAPVPAAEAQIGAARLVSALSALHSRGLLSRDVRPSNVLLDAGGEWRLADAGLNHALGIEPKTSAFAPRELRGWEAAGPSADIYGLGATVHAAVTGAEPSAPEHVRAPVPPGTPPLFASLLDRMLAEDPAERPTLPELDQVLRSMVDPAALARVPPLTQRQAPLPPSPKVAALTELPSATVTATRRRILVGVAAAALFLAGAGAVVATSGDDHGGAQLANAAPTAQPASAPGLPEATAAPAAPTAPLPSRGTSGIGVGAGVDRGWTPVRISAFIYRGRLAAILEWKFVSPDLAQLKVFSAEPDGSDRRFETYATRIKAFPKPVAYTFFFGADIPTRRCVVVQPILRAGLPELRDPRRVCAAEPSPADRALADRNWPAFAKQERGLSRSAKPSVTPRPVTPTPPTRTT